MKTIAIYPGRFQPFGPHHYKAFQWLQNKFGKENTFIATSNKTDNSKSPLNFEDKRSILKQYGISDSQIVMVRNPYISAEILSKFPDDTAVVFMYGEKDAGRLSYTKKDGSQGYFMKYNDAEQLEPYAKRGYVVIAPHVNIEIPGYGEMSGTALRKFIPHASDEVFEKFFGWYDEKIVNMMKKRFGGLKESLNEGNDSTAAVDDGPRFMYGDIKSYKNSLNNPSKKLKDWSIVDWILSDINTLPIHDTEWPKGPVPAVSFYPAGTAGHGTDYFDVTSLSSAYKEWVKHVNNLVGDNVKILSYIDDESFLPMRESITERYNQDTGEIELTQQDLRILDAYADKLFKKYDIDVSFTRHFADRANDQRNTKPITFDELKSIFDDTVRKHGDKISELDEYDSRVIKSMSTDINMPFVINIDNRTGEMKLVMKTIMRKPNFSTSNPVLKVENNDELLKEGGAFGHLSHPYDDSAFTFKDFDELIQRALEGDLDIEGDVQEKTDGQNLMITYKNGKIGAARNKSTILNPMSAEEVASKFKGRGDIETAFVSAMNDLENALKTINEDALNSIFKNGMRFLNIEVIFPSTRNVIDYGQAAYLVFLGMVEFDEKGNPAKNLTKEAARLQQIIEKVNANVQDTFTIIAPKVLQLAKTANFEEKLPYFRKKLADIYQNAGLNINSSLRDYFETKFSEVIDSKFVVDDIAKDILIKRWVDGDKSVRITASNIGGALDDVKEYESSELKSDYKKFVYPIETLFLELGIEVMKNIKDFLTASPAETIQSMRVELAKLIRQARNENDPKVLNTLHTNLKKIKDMGGFDKIIPAEGIVFNYKGRLLKFTGTFAPINQLLGMFRYSR